MLRRSLVIFLEIGAIGIVVVSAVLFWAAYYVDTDEFRQKFLQTVEQVTGQAVTLEGEINIALYPTLSLEILGLTIEGEGGKEDTPLVSFNELRVSARLMPLLSERIELRTIVVEGMTINVVRSKEGVTNWQSMMDRQSLLFSQVNGDGEQTLAVTLSGLEISNAAISYADQGGGDAFTLSGIDLRTGFIAPGQDVPFTAQSVFAWKDGGINSQLILKGVVESEHGGNIRLKDANIYASVGGDFLPQGANPGEMTANVIVDWDKKRVAFDDLQLRFLGIRAKGNIESDNLGEKLSADGQLAFQPFTPSDIVQRYFPDVPVDSIDGLKRGTFTSIFSIDESGVDFKKLAVSLDDLNVKGSMKVQGYRQPSLAFTLRGTDVDLDRYLPLFETGTPFIWDDFNLEFWRILRGRGTVRADSFTVLGEKLTDIRLSVDANETRIIADAGAQYDGVENISGRAEFRIGHNVKAKAPTFGGMLEVNAKSPDGGFPFLDAKDVTVQGNGRVSIKLDVAQMDCLPEARSIGLLRSLSGDLHLVLGAGKGTYGEALDKYELPYSTLEFVLNAKPIAKHSGEYFGFDTDFSLRGHGSKRIKTFSASAQGPLVLAVDKIHFLSSGLRVKSNISGSLYAEHPSRITANGLIGFDSEKYDVDIKDATVRTLETTVNGEAQFIDLNKAFKGSGKLSVPGANVRRIVYLLTKFGLRTDDANALKSASIDTNFTVDSSGFRLSELEGKLDGMSFNGHVVGQGLWNPKLVFSVAAGAFDLDRYLPPSIKPSLKEIREGKEPKKTPSVDLPLTFLRLLRLSGKAWFEEFKLAKVRAKGLSADIEADKGDIRISKGIGKVHGGDLTANWTGKVGADSLSTHLKLHVEDMQAGALLKDMVDREYIRGETDVDFDLISFGKTDDAIVQNMDGKAWARVRNGSFKFTGYDLPNLKEDTHDQPLAALKKSKPVERRTGFSKAVGYFSVNKGVFHADKLRVEAPPVLQSYGKGQFSLPANTIDLSIRNDFVVVPSVTFHLKGKLTDPKVNIPTGEILDKTVRNILSLPEKSFNFLRDLF